MSKGQECVSMHIHDNALDRFIAIYERKFDEPITRDEAAVMARRLVNMYRLFLRPLPPRTQHKAAVADQTEEGQVLCERQGP